MSEQQQLPPVMGKAIKVAAFTGMLIGAYVGYKTEDGIGWQLLRVAGFGVAFAWCTKFVFTRFMHAWLETKLERMMEERQQIEKETQEKDKERQKKLDAELQQKKV